MSFFAKKSLKMLPAPKSKHLFVIEDLLWYMGDMGFNFKKSGLYTYAFDVLGLRVMSLEGDNHVYLFFKREHALHKKAILCFVELMKRYPEMVPTFMNDDTIYYKKIIKIVGS